MVCVLILLDGMATVETRGNGFWEVIGQRGGCSRNLREGNYGDEVWGEKEVFYYI